jgi:hypothetical protein
VTIGNARSPIADVSQSGDHAVRPRLSAELDALYSSLVPTLPTEHEAFVGSVSAVLQNEDLSLRAFLRRTGLRDHEADQLAVTADGVVHVLPDGLDSRWPEAGEQSRSACGHVLTYPFAARAPRGAWGSAVAEARCFQCGSAARDVPDCLEGYAYPLFAEATLRWVIAGAAADLADRTRLTTDLDCNGDEHHSPVKRAVAGWVIAAASTLAVTKEPRVLALLLGETYQRRVEDAGSCQPRLDASDWADVLGRHLRYGSDGVHSDGSVRASLRRDVELLL